MEHQRASAPAVALARAALARGRQRYCRCGQNDTGGAVHVTFGPLKVIVADSREEPRFGRWQTVRRNVCADYRQVFGGDPPERPVSITVWSDSDTTGDRAVVDFDDITLLPPFRRR